MRATLIPSSRICRRSRRACSDRAEVMAFGVRFEGSIGRAFDKKFSLALEEKLGDGADRLADG